MDPVTKARVKIGFGYLKGANAIAGSLGYGALSFVTGHHRGSKHAMQMARWGLMSAKQTIIEGEAELARALGRK